MKGFKNAKIYVEGKGIVTTCLGIENGKIAYIGDDESKIDELIANVPEGSIVLPGFIDEHIHGAAGSDAMDGEVTALSTIANAIASEGTVAFLATTMTQSPKNLLKAMKAVKDYRKSDPADGAEVAGVHLEGPFISTKHVGAQPIKYVKAPDVEFFDKLNKASGNNIRIITMAPEVEGSDAFIKAVSEKGVVVSIGHTDAKYDDIVKAIECGAKNVTHTYNAQRALHHREAGTVGSALLLDELNCELITDTIHVSVPAMKLVFKNKPADKVTLITDAMRAKHMPDGESELGGQLVIVKGGEARLVDGTLAGSVLKMNDAIKNVVTKVGVPFLRAVDSATINPAKTLGIDNKLGSIKVGKNASFAIMNVDYSIEATIRNGKVIYSK